MTGLPDLVQRPVRRAPIVKVDKTSRATKTRRGIMILPSRNHHLHMLAKNNIKYNSRQADR